MESFWDRWSLAGAAVFCWLFLALALGLEHLTRAPWVIPIAFFVLAYIAGGTFATITALRDLLSGAYGQRRLSDDHRGHRRGRRR